MALAAIFHAARAKLARLYEMATQTTSVRIVLDQLSLAARDISAEEGEGDEGEIVSKVVKAWDGNISSALGSPTLEPEARALLMDVQELVSCSVAHDPFRLLFEGIEAKTRELYGDAWRPAVLSVAHTRSHPRPGGEAHDPYAVTALTPWPPAAGRAEIELQVYCDQFGPAAFAALPMLLIHECVCHVAARQDKAKNDSAFAEGFLDWAAYYFLDRWAGTLDPALAPAARTHAEGLKHVLTHQAQGKAAAARRRGHQAAESLFAWFESECGLPYHESRPRVARLAVELNQIDNSIEIKDYFVSMLEQPFPPGLAESLRAWVSGEIDAEQLFDSAVSSLPSYGR